MVPTRPLLVLLLVLAVGLGCSDESSSPAAPSPVSGSPSGLAPALPGSSTSSGPLAASGSRSSAGSPVDVASSRRQSHDSSDRAPGAVSNLRQLPAAGVVLVWDRPAANDYTSLFPVTQYPVERDGVRAATLMARRDCTATTGCIYRDPGLAAGSYTFRVWAENSESGPVSEIAVTVAVTPPAAVRDLAGEQVSGEASVRLTWAPPLAGTDVDHLGGGIRGGHDRQLRFDHLVGHRMFRARSRGDLQHRLVPSPLSGHARLRGCGAQLRGQGAPFSTSRCAWRIREPAIRAPRTGPPDPCGASAG